MNIEDRVDRASDPLLAAAIAELRSETPDIDWDRLRTSINGRAALVLAHRRRTGRRSWTRSLLSLAAAASVAFLLWMGPAMVSSIDGNSGRTARAETVDNERILLEVLGSDLTEQEFRLVITGRSDPEALLAVAISER